MSRTIQSFSWIVGVGGAQVISAVFGLVSNMIYARQLTKGDFGSLAMMMALGLILSVVIDRGMGGFITANFGREAVGPQFLLAWMLRAGFLPVLFMFLAGCVFLALPSSGSDYPLGEVFVGATIAGIAYYFFQVSITVEQVRHRFKHRNLSVVLNGLYTVAGAVAVSVLFEGAMAFLIASAAAYVLAALPGIVSAARVQGPQPETSYSDALTKSRSIYRTNITNYIGVNADVIGVGAIASPAVAASFQASKKFGQMAIMPFTSLLSVLMTRIVAVPETRTVTQRAWMTMVGSVFVLGNVLTFFVGDHLVGAIFGEQYLGLRSLTLILLAVFELHFLRDFLAVFANVEFRFRNSEVSSYLSLCGLMLGFIVLVLTDSVYLFALALAVGHLCAIAYHWFTATQKNSLLLGAVLLGCTFSAFGLAAIP